MPDYTTVALVKDYVGLPASGDAEDTAVLAAVDAAEGRIDQMTGRTFVVPGSATTRDVRPWSSKRIVVPEIAQTTSLAVDVDTSDDGTFDTTLVAADYYVGPTDLAPFTELIRVGGTWPLPRSGRRTVQVTAYFGYAMTVPAEIQQAALMLAARLYLRQSAPLGLQAGVSPEFGAVRVPRVDHDIAALLAGYRHIAVA